MLNIFLIVLMLTGIIVFSIQPAEKSANAIKKAKQKRLLLKPELKGQIASAVAKGVALQPVMVRNTPLLSIYSARKAS